MIWVQTKSGRVNFTQSLRWFSFLCIEMVIVYTQAVWVYISNQHESKLTRQIGNMMKLLNLTKTVLLASSLSVLSIAASAKTDDGQTGHKAHQAGHQQNMHKKMMHKRFKKMAKKLELTKEQRQQVKDIFKNAKEQRAAHQPMMQAFHQSMQTLLTASTFDEQAILALKASYKATFDQLGLIKAKSRYDMFALLTAEQKDKWLLMQEKKMARHQPGEE